MEEKKKKVIIYQPMNGLTDEEIEKQNWKLQKNFQKKDTKWLIHFLMGAKNVNGQIVRKISLLHTFQCLLQKCQKLMSYIFVRAGHKQEDARLNAKLQKIMAIKFLDLKIE